MATTFRVVMSYGHGAVMSYSQDAFVQNRGMLEHPSKLPEVHIS